VRESGALKTFIIKNKEGAFAKITNLGGIIMELHVPTKSGRLRDVVLGFNHPEDYLNPHPYFGAITGRYANRIADGKFSINDQTYQLAKNDKSNNLHGGVNGFDKKIWNVTSVSKSHIVFQIKSPNGDEGFPGELDVRVKYMIDNNNRLLINYRATTTEPTVVNLTNHSYFNLDGAGTGNILNHTLQIKSDAIHPVNENLIPLEDELHVDGTPFDFNKSTKIGEHIDADIKQLKLGSGYDHNYIIRNHSGKLQNIATVTSSDDQVTMKVWSTEPGVQLYTGNHLDNNGKGGAHYASRSGFCLETQHYPNSPNRPDFPSVILKPNEEYLSQTIYDFEND